jgi:pimeloyl-ACP methyl ester carboxylesterase
MHHHHHPLLLFLIFIFLLFTCACSDKKAQEMLDLAQFEELQMNDTHALEIYRDIIKRFPETEAAKTAALKIKGIEKKKNQATELKPPPPEGGPGMTEKKPDYSIIDQPAILQFLFHPRPDYGEAPANAGVNNINIPVDDNITIGARFHHSGTAAPTILFFHGNGEIVSDYDDLGPIYTQMGMNFFPVDYRGYGSSTGTPSVGAMMADAHKIFSFAKNYLSQNQYTGPLIVMGRSLGSAPALELSSSYPKELKGLIIESGFAYAIPLLRLLGVRTESLNFDESQGFDNYGKIEKTDLPTLIIHAEFDHIIPFSDGKALFEASPSAKKRFLKIPGADHNNILAVALRPYMDEVKKLAQSV